MTKPIAGAVSKKAAREDGVPTSRQRRKSISQRHDPDLRISPCELDLGEMSLTCAERIKRPATSPRYGPSFSQAGKGAARYATSIRHVSCALKKRQSTRKISSAIRLFVLEYIRSLA